MQQFLSQGFLGLVFADLSIGAIRHSALFLPYLTNFHVLECSENLASPESDGFQECPLRGHFYRSPAEQGCTEHKQIGRSIALILVVLPCHLSGLCCLRTMCFFAQWLRGFIKTNEGIVGGLRVGCKGLRLLRSDR
jgi:hypothetical protein